MLSFVLCGIIVSLMLLEPVMVVKGQDDRFSSRYITGTVIGMGGRFGGRTLPFRLIVNRYTSADELQQLTAALQGGGQDNLLNTLSKMNAGQIQIGNGVGVPANAIIVTPEEMGGVKITVLYRRDIQFFELRYGTRSSDYRFGYAEIFLGGRGNSQGTFIPAAKVRLRDGNIWEVEDFGEFPARILGVRARSTGRAR
jgi:hypothetical protein